MSELYQLVPGSSLKEQKEVVRRYIRGIRDGYKDGDKEEPSIFKKTPAYREVASCEIANKVYSLDEYIESEFIFTFVGKEREVNTIPIIYHSLIEGRRVAVPKMIDLPGGKRTLEMCEIKYVEDLYRMKEVGFNVLEPTDIEKHVISPRKIDLALIPGMAFQSYRINKCPGIKGEPGIRRLGYGKGYYDRTLGKLRKNVSVVGLALDYQIVDDVPINCDDHFANMVITEKRILQ